MGLDVFFDNINVPIVIYKDNNIREIVYENKSAIFLLNPNNKNKELEVKSDGIVITDLIKMDEDRLLNLYSLLEANDKISDFVTFLHLESGEEYPASISANKMEYKGVKYVKLCLYATMERVIPSNAIALTSALKMAYLAKTTDMAIHNIITFTGIHMKVSRTYIIESVSDTLYSNTYEWCANGVESSIDIIQNLSKEDYKYNEIIERGLVVIDDVRILDDEERNFLEMQGIKSIIIIPISAQDGRPLGYVSFDDCEKHRTWTQEEISFLIDLSEVISSLITRRTFERSLNYSLNVLTKVTDNLDNLMFVRDIDSKKILFTNNVLAEALGISEDEIIGKRCEDILREYGHDSCDNCPLKSMLEEDGNIIKENHIWEFKEPISGKWFLVRDVVIEWIDGRKVHMEMATEITKQKECEEQLRYFASIDMMTGVHNREWGRQLIQNILDNKTVANINSLVFIDLDNLKSTNDQFGHAAGDQLILKTVELIQSCTRRSDALCRWGGDEFILIVRANKVNTELMMQKIYSLVDIYNNNQERSIKLSFSYGIVEIDYSKYKEIDSLIAKADKKMYKNKNSVK